MSLLFEALAELKKTAIARLVYCKKDQTEQICALRIENPDCFLVARKYIFETQGKGIVSANVQTVMTAEKIKVPIKMFIAELKTFLDFDPVYILKHGFVNEREGISFLNWEVEE